MPHSSLGSDQPDKVGLLLPVQRRKIRTKKLGCLALLRPLSRPILETELVFRCSQHPQVSPNAYPSLAHSRSPCHQLSSHPSYLEKYMAVHTTLLPKGNPVSGAGGGTVAEPLVVPQYPFSPSRIIELKLSPGLLRTKATFP